MRSANAITTSYDRTTPRVILVAAALLLVLVVATEATQASCGDYLVVGVHSHAADMSDDGTNAIAAQRPFGGQCHGPQCRQAPAAPIPPPPAPSRTSQQEQADIQRLSDFNVTSPFWYRIVEASERLAPGFPLRLERPPQA